MTHSNCPNVNRILRDVTRAIDATEQATIRAAFKRTRNATREIAELKAKLASLKAHRAAIAWGRA